MKAGNRFGGWRPVLGVVVIGALACAVGAQGGPRVTDGGSARGKAPVKSDATRLVTGDVAHLNSVVSGTGSPATLNFYFTPRAALPGSHASLPYPAGASITGQKLTVSGGGFTSAWITQIEHWDPSGDGNPLLRSMQDKVDSSGFMGSNASPANSGCDLTYPASSNFPCQKTCNGGVNAGLPCTTNGNCPGSQCGDPCPTILGEGGTKCGGTLAGVCDWGWQNTAHPDWFMAANAAPDQFPAAAILSPTGPIFGGATTGGTEIFDGGSRYYTGTLALPVPNCCKGTYTIGHVAAETFAQDQAQPANNIPVAAMIAGQLECQIGACCTPTQCINGLTAAECVAAGGGSSPPFYKAGQVCTNPPTTDGCAECSSPGTPLGATECNDNDACTTDSCRPDFTCLHAPKGSWNQATECCDSATGVETTIGCVPPDQCTTAACSLPGNHGSNVCSATPGAPCNDGNTCTSGDACAGGAGSCAGTPIVGCVLNPRLTFDLDPSPKEEPNCYDDGKITGTVHVGNMTGCVAGGQIKITYDPSCLSYNSIVGVAPYSNTVYGPVVDEAAGTIFVAVSINFGASGTCNGNFDLLAYSFDKIGDCNTCQLCWTDINPQHTYLADDAGQRVSVDGDVTCSGDIRGNNALTLHVPGNIKSNADCHSPTATKTWTPPSVSDTCGTATLFCRGQHESGLTYSSATVNGGGEFPLGVSNFCCYAVSDYCGKRAGCEPNTDCDLGSDGRPIGCWTVDVNDQTSLDITIGLGPNAEGTKVADGLTRCIKFTLYGQSIENPVYFEEDITFGGLFEFVGKFTGKVKVPLGQWQCISAWDQLHTLRSCYRPTGSDCIGGVLHASFSGDPSFSGGNWLIGGNLDGYKKNDNDPQTQPSLFVIDILDWVHVLVQYGQVMDPNTPCGTVGPHADINGDGVVDMGDVAYVQNNFLVSAKECCGAENLPADVQGRTEVSVSELRQMGMGQAVVADLNGDGVLNVDDMTLFMQGQRPGTKVSHDRKGGTR